MTAQIALLFFQVIFSGVTLNGGVTVDAGTPAYEEQQLTSDCSVVTEASWTAGDIVWTQGPFDATPANSSVGDGCAGSGLADAEDISF